MAMERPSASALGQLLVLLLLCIVCTTAGKNDHRLPGFMFTRSGRAGRCSPKFWNGRNEAWPNMVPRAAAVSSVFGWRTYERYPADLTLQEATAASTTGSGGASDAFAELAREASAALLNCYARREGFPYEAWEVKTLLLQALVSEEAAALQARRFSLANEACH